MATLYVTFGQTHAHRVTNATLDKDCVAVINCASEEQGRQYAMKYFKGEYHQSYYEDDVKNLDLSYYPRGFIEVN